MTDNEHQAAIAWLKEAAETNIHAQLITKLIEEQKLFVEDLQQFVEAYEGYFEKVKSRGLDS